MYSSYGMIVSLFACYFVSVNQLRYIVLSHGPNILILYL
jgi:hypothetical protein